MEPSGYLRSLRRHVGLLLVATLIALVVAAGVAMALPKTYTARATLFVQVRSSSASLYERNLFALQRVRSYPALVHSQAVLTDVIGRLGLQEIPERLSGAISATNPPDTVLVVVSAEAPSGPVAARLANAAATALSERVRTIEDSQNTSRGMVTLTPQIAARAPERADDPPLPVLLAAGAILGLLLGTAAAFILEAARPGLLDSADVQRVTGLPVVGRLPGGLSLPLLRRRRGRATARAVGELLRLWQGAPPPVLTVVPADRRSERSGALGRLGDGLAVRGLSVAVVGDARVAKRRRAAGARGFGDLLWGATAADVVGTGTPGTADTVSPGRPVDGIPRGEIAARAAGAVADLATTHDLVLLQPSPRGTPLDVADHAETTRTAVVAVSRVWTSRAAARRAIADLRAEGVSVVGVLFVDWPLRLPIDQTELPPAPAVSQGAAAGTAPELVRS